MVLTGLKYGTKHPEVFGLEIQFVIPPQLFETVSCQMSNSRINFCKGNFSFIATTIINDIFFYPM